MASSSAPRAYVGARTRTWEVRVGAELVGRIVLYQEQGSTRDQVYMVRNPWDQDLGLIDGLGRAYRYLPHQAEPAWVGSGSVNQGAERILGLSSPCRLEELLEPVPGVEARREAAPEPAAIPLAPRPSEGSNAGPPDGGFAQSR
jgi:hypothetical protein